MGRWIGFALMILAIWSGIEIYNHGLADAFGGVLGSAFEAPANRSRPDRAQDAFQRAYNSSEKRVDRVLERNPE